MTRNVFFRDFSICKAVALVGLIGMALALGAMRDAKPVLAETGAEGARIVPVVYTLFVKDCDTHEETGVDL